MNDKIFLAAPIHDALRQRLTTSGFELIELNGLDKKLSLEAALSQVHGIITSNALKITKSIIDAAPNLKWIGRLGSGMEIIDTDYAAQKSIVCFNSAEGNANAVAEQALGMLLSLKHKITSSFEEVKNGIWEREANRGTEIEGQTATIVGFGANGSLFAKKLSTLGLQVQVYDKYKKDFSTTTIKELNSLEDSFTNTDILSFHVPLTEETHHYFNQNLLKKYKKPITLLNLSRGEVVDITAVQAGLQYGNLIGAALDVFEYEPINAGSEQFLNTMKQLLSQPNFLATPHIGGYTHEATFKMSDIIGDKILAFYRH